MLGCEFMKNHIVDSNYTVFKTPKQICSINEITAFCPICNYALCKEYTLIPISKTKSAKIDGYYCRKCDNLYVIDFKNVENLLQDNFLAKDFTLDGLPLWNATKREKEKAVQEKRRFLIKEKIKTLNSIPSAEFIITIKLENRTELDVIIVNDKKYEDTSKNIFYYTNFVAREILCAKFIGSRKKRGILNNRKFKILHCFMRSKNSKNIILERILLKKDGGFYSSLINDNFELFDALVYSSKTNNYEILQTTHIIDEDCYCIDAKAFLYFVRKHGKPPLDIESYEIIDDYDLSYENLKETSLLRDFGYTVNQNSNLTIKERQVLLGELIDFELISKDKVINHLEFCIKRHPQSNCANARYIWQKDIEFVKKYKAKDDAILDSNKKI